MPNDVSPKAVIGRTRQARENRDLVDMDYFEQLSPEDQAYLADFINEYYRGRGSRRGKRRNDALNMPDLVWDSDFVQVSNELTPEEHLLLKELALSKKDAKKVP